MCVCVCALRVCYWCSRRPRRFPDVADSMKRARGDGDQQLLPPPLSGESWEREERGLSCRSGGHLPEEVAGPPYIHTHTHTDIHTRLLDSSLGPIAHVPGLMWPGKNGQSESKRFFLFSQCPKHFRKTPMLGAAPPSLSSPPIIGPAPSPLPRSELSPAARWATAHARARGRGAGPSSLPSGRMRTSVMQGPAGSKESFWTTRPSRPPVRPGP